MNRHGSKPARASGLGDARPRAETGAQGMREGGGHRGWLRVSTGHVTRRVRQFVSRFRLSPPEKKGDDSPTLRFKNFLLMSQVMFENFNEDSS
jgi:hypothetical protein